jgi:hypothetical protein
MFMLQMLMLAQGLELNQTNLMLVKKRSEPNIFVIAFISPLPLLSWVALQLFKDLMRVVIKEGLY